MDASSAAADLRFANHSPQNKRKRTGAIKPLAMREKPRLRRSLPAPEASFYMPAALYMQSALSIQRALAPMQADYNLKGR
ncbi:hypothetical protein C5689_07255 [Methylosinus sporium]|uniref:Uncharacterized protein n=1 Tax=Methylosinus sporium TaxID=428 RepID=A0A2U1SSH3_METSR|nr:hypothetical protein C5689_07255 [Methylosinus sporium]